MIVMTNLVIIAVVAVIVAAAAAYIYKEKKRGKKCIGCPGGSCASKNCTQQGNCSCRH